MSRIGKLPVAIPAGVNVTVGERQFTVEGPKGKLTQDYQSQVVIKIDGSTGHVTRKNDSKRAKSFHGLYRNLLNNMVIGVSAGFTRTLVINGVGYRAEVKGKVLVLSLGYSNPIEYPIPEDLTIDTEGTNKINVRGIDKARVGQIASELRSLRPPEPYKGKGVRYENENVRRKVGKTGVK
ncbi:MAG TPA: 50S ribosomal protein L6 [Spirochaetia bacterium]|nr:50S ribosomal protein L6 [Spirochaetia bacterium]